MKIDALDHPKTITLSAELGISLPQTIGHLELLWAFVAQKTPQGNIGKWQNSVIAHAAQWQGDAETFVSALVKVGFFDEDQEHRLLVHDWIDHMPNWVRAKLTKSDTPVFSNVDTNANSNADTTREGRGSQGKGRQEKPSDKGRFTPPHLEAVAAYCLERGNKVDPEVFIDFYDSKGWYVGKNKMKDWKAAVRTWEKKRGNGNGQAERQGKSTAYDRTMSAIDEWERAQGASVIDGESVAKDD